MIKAILSMTDGTSTLLLGLSSMNIERLREGLPVVFELAPLGTFDKIAIMWGETEDAIKAEIEKHFGGPARGMQ